MEKIKPTTNKETAKEEQPKEVHAENQTEAGSAPKLSRSPLHGLWALTNRDLRKWYTNPVQLLTSLIQPVVWLALFGKALNFGTFISGSGATLNQQNQILQGFFGTTSYFSFPTISARPMTVYSAVRIFIAGSKCCYRLFLGKTGLL